MEICPATTITTREVCQYAVESMANLIYFALLLGTLHNVSIYQPPPAIRKDTGFGGEHLGLVVMGLCLFSDPNN